MVSQIGLIIEQIVIMMLLMAVGYVVYKLKMIDDYTTKQLSSLVLYVVVPCIMLVSFTQDYSYGAGCIICDYFYWYFCGKADAWQGYWT